MPSGEDNSRDHAKDVPKGTTGEDGSGDKEDLGNLSFLPATPELPEVPRLEKVRPPDEDLSRHPVARWSQSGAAASITSTLVVPVALFSYLGYLLDEKLHHTTPYCALLGFVLGVIGSGVGVYNLLQRLK